MALQEDSSQINHIMTRDDGKEAGKWELYS